MAIQSKGFFMDKQNDSVNELKKQLNALRKFPDQNPNPVLRISMDGKLKYANGTGQYIQNEWKIGLGDDVPTELVEHSKLDTPSPLEMEVGNKVFAFHVVAVPEFGLSTFMEPILLHLGITSLS